MSAPNGPDIKPAFRMVECPGVKPGTMLLVAYPPREPDETMRDWILRCGKMSSQVVNMKEIT